MVSATTVLVSCLLLRVPVENEGTTGTAETLDPAIDISRNNLYILLIKYYLAVISDVY